MGEGPMNLGPKDELLPVKRDTIESVLVALNPPRAGMNPLGWEDRRRREQERLRRILREGKDG